MKRNVNFLLFGLVLLSVIAIIAISVLYSIRYDRFKESSGLLEKDLMAKAEELNKTMAEVKAKEELLNQKERVLSSYISELNLSKERETSLGGHFIDLKNEKVYLEDKLNKTLLDRDKWKTYYDTTKKDFDVCRLDYELEKDRSEERLNEILRIRNLKPGLQTSTGRLKEREDDAEANARAIGSSVENIRSLAESIEDPTLKDKIKSEADTIMSKANSIESLLEKMLENIGEIEYYVSRI